MVINLFCKIKKQKNYKTILLNNLDELNNKIQSMTDFKYHRVSEDRDSLTVLYAYKGQRVLTGENIVPIFKKAFKQSWLPEVVFIFERD